MEIPFSTDTAGQIRTKSRRSSTSIGARTL